MRENSKSRDVNGLDGGTQWAEDGNFRGPDGAIMTCMCRRTSARPADGLSQEPVATSKSRQVKTSAILWPMFSPVVR